MMNTPKERSDWISPLAYFLLSLGLLFHPLLGILHVESSAVVAFFSFFLSGYYTLRVASRSASFRRTLWHNLAYLAIPLLLLSASLPWRPNCGYMQGLLFFVLFPVITVAFATSLATLLRAYLRRGRTLSLVIIGLCIAAGGVMFDFLLHPQFYTYNHVFGGVLGPIYDEELAIRPGLFAFRALTLVWAAIFVSFAKARTDQQTAPRVLGFVLLIVVTLVFFYRGPVGINTTERVLTTHLDESRSAQRYHLRLQSDSVTEERLAYLEREIQFEIDRLAVELKSSPTDTIKIYLYPDPETKAAIVGSRETSVTPVWLREPQIHMLESEFDNSFSHELVHVFSREFGSDFLHISPSPGLIEGLAVAFEQPNNAPSSSEIWEAAKRDSTLRERFDIPLSDAFQPIRFWLGRGAVSYTRAGSFVGFLRNRFGVEKIKRLYRSGSFAETYEQEMDSLEALWIASLDSATVDGRLVDIARIGFRAPALVERRCPHHLPRWVRTSRNAQLELAQGDSTKALALFRKSYLVSGNRPTALDPVLRLQLALGMPMEVPTDSLTGQLLIRGADSAAIAGNLPLANSLYDSLSVNIPDPFVSRRLSLSLRRILAEDGQLLKEAYRGNWQVVHNQDHPSAEAFAFFAAQDYYRQGEYSRATDLLPEYNRLIQSGKDSQVPDLDGSEVYHLILLQTEMRLAANRPLPDELQAALMDCPAEAYEYQCRYGLLLTQKAQFWFEE